MIGPTIKADYPELVLAGTPESARLFHEDVVKVVEAFAELMGVKA